MEENKNEMSVEQMIQAHDESTSASWFWCLLFGPLWFLFIGAYKWAIIALIGNLLTVGVANLIWPFFSYRAHRELAISKIKENVELSSALK